MKQLVFFVFTAFIGIVYGQHPRYIQWNEPALSKPNVSAVLPLDDRRFYVQYFGGTNLMPVTKIALYQDGVEIESKKVDLQLGQTFVTLEQFFTFQGKLYGCFSHRTNTNYQVFIQPYTLEALPEGNPILACEYVVSRGKNKDRIINIIKSPTEKYFAVEYIVTGKNENYDMVGFTVFNQVLKRHFTDELEIPYESSRSLIELRTVTDNGDYFLGVHIFSKTSRSVWVDFRSVEKSILYQRTKDTLTQYELPLSEKRIYNFGLVANDTVAVITGTWGNEQVDGANGLFYARLDLTKKNLWNIVYTEFTGDMLIKTQFDIDLSNNTNKRQDQESLVNYAFRNLLMRPDGSVVVLTEQYYFYEYNSTDSRGLSNYISYYYYNDCLIYSLSPDGKIGWFARIPKQQESINDYGYQSSVISYVHDDKMFIYFNDDMRNYSLSREFKGWSTTYSPAVRNKNYGLAECELDLMNGESKRHIINDYDLIKGTVVTKLSKVDYAHKQILFYVQGKKEKYGYLRF